MLKRSIEVFSALMTAGLLGSAPADAAPVPAAQGIASAPGVDAVRIYEATASFLSIDFSVHPEVDARLFDRIGGLGSGNRDFGFYPGDENYDVFFSDADGALDPDGRYITIEGNCNVALNCFNVVGISLVLADGSEDFASELTRVVYGRPGSFTPGTGALAVDVAGNNLATYTQLGDTIGLGPNARMSITVGGFASIPAIPEPETLGLLGAGLVLLGLRLRRSA